MSERKKVSKRRGTEGVHGGVQKAYRRSTGQSIKINGRVGTCSGLSIVAVHVRSQVEFLYFCCLVTA